MKDKFRFMITVFCCLFLMATASTLSAQDQQGQEGQSQQQDMMQQPDQSAEPIEVSDAELDKVAQAYVQITEIRGEFQETLSDVSDPEKAQQLQEEAGEKMVQAVQDNGLDVQKYNEVMEAAQVDEELREKLLARMEEME
ncbi:MAG: DUF4168 domain-containing protein [Desulfonatronovibrio sp.]